MNNKRLYTIKVEIPVQYYENEELEIKGQEFLIKDQIKSEIKHRVIEEMDKKGIIQVRACNIGYNKVLYYTEVEVVMPEEGDM